MNFKQALKELKETHRAELRDLRNQYYMFELAEKHIKDFRELSPEVSFVGHVPCVDIDLYLRKKDAIKTAYPMVDALIRDPNLEMTAPLPTSIASKSNAIDCTFNEKDGPGTLRVYIWLTDSQVCREVGTGKYKEVMRVACGHYDPEGNFVEDEDNGRKEDMDTN